MKPQLHISALNTLQTCGEQFRLRYLERIPSPPSPSMLIGTGVDVGVTSNLRSVIDTGVPLPKEQVLDSASDAVNAAWDEGVHLLEELEDGLTEGEAKGMAVDSAVRLSRLHYDEHAPTLRPTHVQESWTLEVAGLPVDLVGTMDIREGLDSIRDTKTKKATPPANQADISLQLTMYAMAVYAAHKVLPGQVALDYLVRTKTPKLAVRVSTRTREDFQPLIDRIGAATRAMESGIFMPANPDDWHCSAKYCAYFSGICRYAAKPKIISIQGSTEGAKK